MASKQSSSTSKRRLAQAGTLLPLAIGLANNAVAPMAPTAPTAAVVSTSANTIWQGWEKPQPNQSQFSGPDGTCGATGDGGDVITNARKNRTDAPLVYHDVTFPTIAGLPFPKGAKPSRLNWTPAQLAEIQPYEGVAVHVTGYLAALKKEGPESTNCHFKQATEVDWHLALVEQSGQGEETAVVVEVTPRVRQLHPHWTAAALAASVDQDIQIRVSGWTMLDPEHQSMIGTHRVTIWEIHPITELELLKNGQWVNLDVIP